MLTLLNVSVIFIYYMAHMTSDYRYSFFISALGEKYVRKKLFALFGVYVVTVLILTSCTNSRHNTVYLNKGQPYLTVLQQQNKKLVNQFFNENTLLSHNADGTYDLTMFSSPVYIEEARTRNIIDNTIELMDNSPCKYTNHRNDVKTCLPEQLSENQGIQLSYKTKKLTIYPQTAESKKAKKDNHTRRVNGYGH